MSKLIIGNLSVVFGLMQTQILEKFRSYMTRVKTWNKANEENKFQVKIKVTFFRIKVSLYCANLSTSLTETEEEMRRRISFRSGSRFQYVLVNVVKKNCNVFLSLLNNDGISFFLFFSLSSSIFKGQLISKRLFLVIGRTKKPTKFF